MKKIKYRFISVILEQPAWLPTVFLQEPLDFLRSSVTFPIIMTISQTCEGNLKWQQACIFCNWFLRTQYYTNNYSIIFGSLTCRKTLAQDPSRDRNPDVSHQDTRTNWLGKSLCMFFNCVVFLNETLIHNSLPRNNRLTLLLPTGTWSSAARHSDAGIFIPSTETAKDHNKTLMLLFMPSIALQAVRATVSRAEMFLFWWSPYCPVLTARPAPSPLWCPLSVTDFHSLWDITHTLPFQPTKFPKSISSTA